MIKTLCMTILFAGLGCLLSAEQPATPKPEIQGIAIPRDNGGYLGLVIDNHTFAVSFYDAKKEPITSDVARILARWHPQYTTHYQHAVLKPSDNHMTLSSPQIVRPPYNFRLYLTLVTRTGGVETHAVDINQ